MYCNLINKCRIGSVNKTLYYYKLHNHSFSDENKKIYNAQLIKNSRIIFKKNLNKFKKFNKDYKFINYYDAIIYIKI